MPVEYAYDFASSNVEPKRAPQEVPQRNPRVNQNEKPDLRRVQQQRINTKEKEKAAYASVLKFSAVLLVFVVAFIVACSSFIAVNTSRSEATSAQEQLGIYQSKLVEVEARLNALVTPDKIAEIATGKLGMIKLPDSNKLYASSNGKNEIIVSSDKTESESKDK